MAKTEQRLERNLTVWFIAIIVFICLAFALGDITKMIAIIAIWLLLLLVNFLWPFNLMIGIVVGLWVLHAEKKLSVRRRKILISAVVLGSVVLLGHFVYDAIRYRQTYNMVEHARIAAEATAEHRLANMRNALQSTGLVGEPMASSKVDVCYVTHADIGWFVHSWYQECYVRYLEGYYTTADGTDILNKAQLLAGSFGKLQTEYRRSSFPCDIFESGDSETLRYRSTAPHDNDAFSCGLPRQTSGTYPSYDEFDDKYSIKTYREFDPASIDLSKRQLWIIIQPKLYYDEDLGCRMSIFCENPRSMPIQAK